MQYTNVVPESEVAGVDWTVSVDGNAVGSRPSAPLPPSTILPRSCAAIPLVLGVLVALAVSGRHARQDRCALVDCDGEYEPIYFVLLIACFGPKG